MTNWIILDDAYAGLAPLADLRAVFEQRSGGDSTLERLTRQLGSPPSGFICEDDDRAALIAERTGLERVLESDDLIISGRWLGDVPPEVGDDAAICDAADGSLIARSGGGASSTDMSDAPMLRAPWSLLDHLPRLLAGDLEAAEELGRPDGGACVGDHRIDVHSSATLFAGVVLDATAGAVRIEADATIRPNAVLCGPCWIGAGTTIIDGAHIKANAAIGPGCKIGGEVGGTIFQGYSNKCHDGHLGDSVVGEWVNLGAGTTNSNLLNTYGDVIVTDLDGTKHRTDRAFVGCFLGDHVRTAIGTRIMTGTVVGTGAMIASTTPPPTPTPRFAWLTDSASRAYRMDKFIDVARTVMGRRNAVLSAAAEAVIRRLGD